MKNMTLTIAAIAAFVDSFAAEDASARVPRGLLYHEYSADRQGCAGHHRLLRHPEPIVTALSGTAGCTFHR